MIRILSKVPFVCVLGLLAPIACDDAAEPSSAAPAEPEVAPRALELPPEGVKAIDGYYTVRRDVRRCLFPLCGGWWVSTVNRSRTVCADGSEAEACYVAELELPLGIEVGEGDVLHGSLELRQYEGFEVPMGIMTVDFAYAPTLADQPSWGYYNLAYDNGIRCITTPCPSVSVARLDTQRGWVGPELLFFGADQAEDELLESAFSAEFGDVENLAGTGAIVFGNVYRVFGQSVLIGTNVYTSKQPVEAPSCLILEREQGVTAWNVRNEAEAFAIAGGFEPDDVWAVAPGTCDAQEIGCIQLFDPVFGTIDALGEACVDYGNACEFRAASIRAAGSDSKATGSWAPGECG